MPENAPTPPSPNQTNFELQEVLLAEEQARISGELFEQGAASRIMGDATPMRGAVADLQGLSQLDKLFVPSFATVQDDEHTERVLSLVAVTNSQDGRGRSFTYRPVGRVDNTNTLYPYPNIEAADAEAVHRAAQQLEKAQADGLLTNLDANLLSIDNPRTGITSTSVLPKE